MAAHKVPNYHYNRCEKCGRFMALYGGRIIEEGYLLYPIEVCFQCWLRNDEERYYHD